MIDGEQNPPSNPRSEDEGEFSMDVVMSIIFFLQRKKACLFTVVQCIKRSSRGEIKPLWHCGKVTASAGSYDDWSARQTQYFPQHKQQLGVYYKTGLTSMFSRAQTANFRGEVGWGGRMWRKSAGLQHNLMPQEVEQTMKRCVTTLHFNDQHYWDTIYCQMSAASASVSATLAQHRARKTNKKTHCKLELCSPNDIWTVTAGK